MYCVFSCVCVCVCGVSEIKQKPSSIPLLGALLKGTEMKASIWSSFPRASIANVEGSECTQSTCAFRIAVCVTKVKPISLE